MPFTPIFVALFLLAGELGYAVAPSLFLHPSGAALPSATAVFETSLQSAITSSATTMTLSANSVRGGGTLAGFNCFTIDEGSAQAETICGTVSGTTVSSLTRGVSQSTGTTTVSALQFAHRRGANVKITDFPLIQILKAQNNGEDTYPNLMSYTSGTACSGTSGNSTICDKAYIDGVAVAGASNANETTKGIVESGTQIEMASSTSLGATGASLYVQAKYSTSSPQSAGIWNVITQNDGKISPLFIATSSAYAYTWGALHIFTASTTFMATTTIAASNASTTALVLNGLPYQFSTSRGASSSVLMENGWGHLSWVRPDGYLLASTTFSGASATTTLTLPAYSGASDLKIVFDSGTISGATNAISMQFNTDTGNNYSWSATSQAGASTGIAATGAMRICPNFNDSGAGYYMTADVTNTPSRIKHMHGICSEELSASGVSFYTISDSWNNTAQITSISVGCGATTCPATARLSVYASSQ